MSRYARQTILPEIGEKGQHRLAEARVLVVGAGGLAAPALPILAGAGVGHLTIVDGDTVALSNLHRQTLFTEADSGQPKAVVAAERCRAINGHITVKALVNSITPASAADLIRQFDVVLDCADSYAVSYLLSDLCLARTIPLISASVLGLGGYVGGYCGSAPSVRAVFPDAPDSGASCESAGVLGPVVGVIGMMQAQMALNFLLSIDPSPLGQVVHYDGRGLRASGFRFDHAPEPNAPLRFVAASDLSDRDRIVDLREDGPLLHPQAQRLTAEDIAGDLPLTDTRLVLCCATGLRAWRAAEYLRETWPGEIVLVAASAS
ncbi:MAG: ThiF family adenylyltransferase [Jhaorihella sp.]